jgi:hypothetical protein
VDMCLNNGTDCGVPAAKAFCQYLGFEGVVPGTIKQTPAETVTRSFTGVLPVALEIVVAFFRMMHSFRNRIFPASCETLCVKSMSSVSVCLCLCLFCFVLFCMIVAVPMPVKVLRIKA